MPAGVYDATLQNPNGKRAQAPGAVAVVDRPTLSGTTPALLCLSQSERELGLSGLSFLRIGEARPQLHVSDVTQTLGVSSLEDCTFGGVAGSADGTSAQLCDGTGGCGPLPDLNAFGENRETATRLGLFGALGAELQLGPGAALLELSLSWAHVDGYILRDTSVGALGIGVGYRVFL